MVQRRSGFLAAATAAMIIAAGCTNGETLVGTWATEGPVPIEMTLLPDGQYTCLIKGRMKLKTTGIWTYKRPHLYLEVKDVTFPDNAEMAMIPDAIKQEAMKKYANVECAVSWKTKNQIVVSGQPPFMGSFKRMR